jgi:16S rRNA (guanine527-N7)-methyltransferase
MRSPHPAQIEPIDLFVDGALALGVHLTPGQVAAFATYLGEIVRWNVRINLTAIRKPEDIVRVGFLDSLACLPLIPPEAKRAVDIGSGAGFPGVPLKIALPHLSFTLVEASRKKATFLQHTVRQLGMSGVRVVQRRVETLATDKEEMGTYDLATARAVAPLLDQGRLARPLLRPGGLFLAQIGPDSFEETNMEQLEALGFHASDDLTLPAFLGGPGRRVLAFRRLA